MATISLLKEKVNAERVENPSAPWTETEAAVELLLNALGVTELP